MHTIRVQIHTMSKKQPSDNNKQSYCVLLAMGIIVKKKKNFVQNNQTSVALFRVEELITCHFLCTLYFIRYDKCFKVFLII